MLGEREREKSPREASNFSGAIGEFLFLDSEKGNKRGQTLNEYPLHVFPGESLFIFDDENAVNRLRVLGREGATAKPFRTRMNGPF